MTISAIQARLARSLLKLTGAEIAEIIGVTKAPLHKFESEGAGISLEKRDLLQKFFESRGVEFLDYDGVRPNPKTTTVHLQGEVGFKIFMNDVFETVRETGGLICVANVNERYWIKWMGQESYNAHAARMATLDNFKFYILVRETDDFFIASNIAEYRGVPDCGFSENCFYAYGDKLALINFSDDTVELTIHNNQALAEGMRYIFNLAWIQAKKK